MPAGSSVPSSFSNAVIASSEAPGAIAAATSGAFVSIQVESRATTSSIGREYQLQVAIAQAFVTQDQCAQDVVPSSQTRQNCGKMPLQSLSIAQPLSLP